MDRWAEVLVDYSTELKPGDRVSIGGGIAAEPLLRSIYRTALRRGALAVLAPSFSEAQADLLEDSRTTSSWVSSRLWSGGRLARPM